MTDKKSRDTLVKELTVLLEKHQTKFSALVVHTNLYKECRASHQTVCPRRLLEKIINNFDYYLNQAKTKRSLLPQHPKTKAQFKLLKVEATRILNQWRSLHDAAEYYGMTYPKAHSTKHHHHITNIDWFCENSEIITPYLEFENVRYDLVMPEQRNQAKRVLARWIRDQADIRPDFWYTTSRVFFKGYYSSIEGGLNNPKTRWDKINLTKLLNIVNWLGQETTIGFLPTREPKNRNQTK